MEGFAYSFKKAGDGTVNNWYKVITGTNSFLKMFHNTLCNYKPIKKYDLSFINISVGKLLLYERNKTL